MSFNFCVMLKHICQFCDEITGGGWGYYCGCCMSVKYSLPADSYYPAQRARVRSRGQGGPKMWLQDWRWDRPRLQEESAGIHRQCMSSTLAPVHVLYLCTSHNKNIVSYKAGRIHSTLPSLLVGNEEGCFPSCVYVNGFGSVKKNFFFLKGRHHEVL